MTCGGSSHSTPTRHASCVRASSSASPPRAMPRIACCGPAIARCAATRGRATCDGFGPSSRAPRSQSRPALPCSATSGSCSATAAGSFVMYGVQGLSWISCGDPVGRRAEWSDLLWAFREMSDRHGGRTVLYEVSTETLPLCVDLGLSLFKIGEEGRIRLGTFSLQGGARKELRYVHRRAQKDGLSFAVLPESDVESLLPRLRTSRTPGSPRAARRKRASRCGAFVPEYLVNFPCAVVRRGETIVAFANVWHGADREGVLRRLDALRSGAPKGVMDYLFIELMLWGRDQGYEWFSLGMASTVGSRRASVSAAVEPARHAYLSQRRELLQF